MRRSIPVMCLVGASALACATTDGEPYAGPGHEAALTEADFALTDEMLALIVSDEPIPPDRELAGGTGERWTAEGTIAIATLRPAGTLVVLGRLSGEGYTRTLTVERASEGAPTEWAPGAEHLVAVPSSCEDEAAGDGPVVVVVRDYRERVAMATLLPGRRGSVAAVPPNSTTVRLGRQDVSLDELMQLTDDMNVAEGVEE